MWFDTHAHLSDPQFDSDRDAAIQRALSAGVARLIEIADGPSEWEKAQKLSEAYPQNIWWAAGLHPYYAAEGSPEVWKKLRELANAPRFVAIGEVGLDYAKATVPADVQKKAFREAIELALDVKKPLIIHCRNAFPDLHALLDQPSYSGVVHCFSGTFEDAEKLLAQGFHLGVDGPLTYPSAKGLREVMAAIPLERIVLETDAPYLPPQTHRGQRNEPAHVATVGVKLAEIRALSVNDLHRITYDNACALFKLNPHDFSS